MTSPSPAAIAFLCIAFAAVGLTGVFATYAAPLPLERALAREATLDEAAAAARGPDPNAALAAMRPRLGDSADAVLGSSDPAAFIDRERAAVRSRLLAEAGATGWMLRWLVVLMTAMGAVFGVVVMRLSSREADRSTPALPTPPSSGG